MTVRVTPLSVALPGLFFWLFGAGPPTPAGGGQKDGYEKSPPKPPAGTTSPFPFASFFAPKAPPQKKPSIGERVKHIYQERLKPPSNKCRHAVLKMIGDYLRNEFVIPERTVREILPHEIYNGEIDAVISGWRRPNGFEGPVRNPDAEDLQGVLNTIDAHLDAGLPVPVYVSHTTGLHVVLVTDRLPPTSDGHAAYRFVDPATHDESKSRGTLVWADTVKIKGKRSRTKKISVNNFVKPGSTDKKVRGTANHQYYLLGVYSYKEKFDSVVSSESRLAKAD